MSTKKQKQILVTPEQALAPIKVDVLTTRVPYTLNTQTEVNNAVALCGEIKTAIAKIEEIRKFFVGPLDKQVRAINALFRPKRLELEKAEELTKNVILAFNTKQRRKAEEQAQKREAGDKKAIRAIDVPTPQATVLAGTSLMATKFVWTFEVVNEDDIPPEFWTLDAVAIRAAIHSGARHINGLRVYQKEQLSITA